MNTDSGSWFHRHRGAILIAGITVAIGLWWLFRPEALFINRQVSETAPADVAEIQPVFTGSLHTVGTAAPTTGRVNILKTGPGFQLEISDLESQATGPFTVGMAAADTDTQPAGLGTVSASGHEKLTLPAGVNPDGHRIVLLMDHSNQIVAKANLEPF
jgi:hypothetical protein